MSDPFKGIEQEPVIAPHSTAGRMMSQRRRRKFVLLGLFVIFVLCTGLGLGGAAVVWWMRPVGAVAEERSEAKNETEELVRRYIVNNAEKPEAIRFVKWGPHMSRAEVEAMVKEGGAEKEYGDVKFDYMVRVVYFRPRSQLELMAKTNPSKALQPPEEDEMPLAKLEILLGKDKGRKEFDKRRREKQEAVAQKAKDQAEYDKWAKEAVKADEFYFVKGKLVQGLGIPIFGLNFGTNQHGDDWKKHFRKEMAKQFPAIDPEK